MKNKIFAFIILSVFSISLSAQQKVRCNTMEMDSLLRSTHQMETLEDFEYWLQAKIAAYKASPQYHAGQRSVVTIPVIVHIIHNGDAVGSSENISQARVMSQITVLNEDFRKAAGTPGFNTNAVGADCEVEFCPAVVDPNGNVLTEPGIDRQNKGQSSWDRTAIESTLKPQTIWDPTRYCNIWTVAFGGTSSNLLGYAQFPAGSGLQGLGTGGSANTDGVVIDYESFGRYNNPSSPYDGGRTLTHELGHWLGLRHIWGDGTCGNDYCNDTPTSSDANYGCPNGQNTCPDAGNDMVENYMDYTDDGCMNIFTQDQKTRIVTVLNNATRRSSLTTSTVCTIPLTFSYTGRVVDATNAQGIANAKVIFDGQADYNATTDVDGYFTISNLQQGNYTFYAGKWGYITNYASSQLYNPNTGQVTLALQPGYYDDFLFDFGWTTTSTASSGAWVRDVPTETTYNGAVCNPGADVSGDFGDECFVTGNGGGQAGTDDVDGGTVTLTSPSMNLSSYTNPVVRFYRWFYNAGGSGSPDDSLIISLVNGTQVIDMDKVGRTATTNQWTYKSYRIKDFIATPGNNIYLRARVFDSSTGHLVEAGLDLFRVFDSTGISSLPPVANFSSSATQVCAGTQVSFSDLSTNNPTVWAWQFPGGTPSASNSANPQIQYNTPGTYSVTLTSTNGGGSNTSVQTGFITVNSVVASFLQDNYAVCPGYPITFYNNSSCNPTSIRWTFAGGDISTSTIDSPVVTYLQPGYYPVKLVVTNAYGADSINELLAVQVYSRPSLSTASVSDTDGVGLGTATVNVTGGFIPYTYSWNDPLHQTTATAVGLSAGTYTVTVVDGRGCQSITSLTVGNVVINGISSLENQDFVRVFPNPVTAGSWRVVTSVGRVGDKWNLTNAVGQLLQSGVIQSGVTNVSSLNLPSGVYLLQVEDRVLKLIKE